ncbi:MAG TPA: hypothetical protein VFV70_15180 [Hyphomonadaceae bacterium]|nr:hypothetical protein [Hyphomonadaceae bacterium]
MTANVSTWIRAFRPSLQRAYPQLAETDRDLAELLRKADERTREQNVSSSGDVRRKR